MTEKEIIDFCLTLDNTFEDRQLYLNVKTNPEYSELLRNTYKYIIPAYHMNKQHWNTIIVSEKVDSNLVKKLLLESYELTNSKK